MQNDFTKFCLNMRSENINRNPKKLNIDTFHEIFEFKQTLERLQLMRFRKHLIIYVFLGRRRRNLLTLREIGDV